MAELPDRLREAAHAHRPDRERMLDRVERAMIAPSADRPAAHWMRVAAVTAAAASAIGIGGLAVGAVSHDGDAGQSPDRGVAASTAATAPPSKPPAAPATAPDHATGYRHRHGDGTAADKADGGRLGPARDDATPSVPTTPTTPTAPPASPLSPPAAAAPPVWDPAGPPTSGPGSGTRSAPPLPLPPLPPLPSAPPTRPAGASSTGSAVSDSSGSQTLSTITLTVEHPLTALTVELRVARTAQVTDTGASSSDSPRTCVTVDDQGPFLVYRWTLQPGQVLQPGSYTFSARFAHAAGRDTRGDSYSVTGIGSSGPVGSHGRF